MSNSTHRTETDSLGSMQVANDALFGAQTQRAIENFPLSGHRLPRPFILAVARLKRAAATVNLDLGHLDSEVADAIVRAASEVLDGKHWEQFPVDVFQTGSGTSTNMNVNEVLANRAADFLGKPRGVKVVHPNDHVNLGQSSNDVIPSALHVAVLSELEHHLLPALVELEQELNAKAREFDEIVKTARTHLQDAVPMRLGDEFSGFARQIHLGQQRIASCRPRLCELALGATAAGTGLNAAPGFAEQVIARLADELGQPLVPAQNYFEALASRDAAVELSGALKVTAVSLMKICNDLRLLGSGPRCGLGELELPSIQPGSSIMPGKVNPVLPEAVCMISAQVIGNDAAITVAGQSGLLQLNVMLPLIAYNLLESIELLGNACQQLARRCVRDIRANPGVCEAYAERSLGLATALAPALGYDQAAKLAQRAYESGQAIRDVVAETQLDSDTLSGLLDLSRISRPSGEPPLGKS